MKKTTKRSGFTLVELLIVIVVIGVLSAMMMLSSTEAVSSAKAADIISDLRNLKTAALAYYADNITTAETKDFNLQNSSADVLKYLGTNKVNAGYKFVGNQNIGSWYAQFDVSDGKVKEKLASRASSVGLCLGASSKDVYNATATGNGTVGMFIR